MTVTVTVTVILSESNKRGREFVWLMFSFDVALLLDIEFERFRLVYNRILRKA